MNELALSFDKKLSKGKLAIIDIGSNSIRLVIYPQNGKYPFPLFNERINCRLGEGVTKGKKLSSVSISRALSAIKRFAFIIKSMSVKSQIPVATAAVRNAINANEFIRPAEKLLNSKIRVLSSKEEAEYACLGLLSYMRIENGLIADLGGGSLELILVNNGIKVHASSLDIGHLSKFSNEEIIAQINKIKWLKQAEGLTLYGTGGSFRAFGSAYIKNYNYPLHLIHGLSFKKEKAIILLDKITDSKVEVLGIPPSRQHTIETAANIIINLILKSNINRLTISGTSIRDGLIAELNEETITNSNTVDHYKILARNQRFKGMHNKVIKLFNPILKKITNKGFKKAFKISTYLSDISWDEQPDLRGYMAANKILSLPIRDLTHIERIWMARVVYHRYVGLRDRKQIEQSIINLLSEEQKISSYAIGLGLRFVYIFCAGFPKNLENIKLKIRGNKLVCKINPDAKALMDKENIRRFKNFAKACNLHHEII